MMLNQCFVKNCTSSGQLTFSVPSDDPSLVTQWIEVLPGRERPFDPKSDQVCAAHFASNVIRSEPVYILSGGQLKVDPKRSKTFLAPGAVPTIFSGAENEIIKTDLVVETEDHFESIRRKLQARRHGPGNQSEDDDDYESEANQPEHVASDAYAPQELQRPTSTFEENCESHADTQKNREEQDYSVEQAIISDCEVVQNDLSNSLESNESQPVVIHQRFEKVPGPEVKDEVRSRPASEERDPLHQSLDVQDPDPSKVSLPDDDNSQLSHLETSKVGPRKRKSAKPLKSSSKRPIIRIKSFASLQEPSESDQDSSLKPNEVGSVEDYTSKSNQYAPTAATPTKSGAKAKQNQKIQSAAPRKPGPKAKQKLTSQPPAPSKPETLSKRKQKIQPRTDSSDKNEENVAKSQSPPPPVLTREPVILLEALSSTDICKESPPLPLLQPEQETVKKVVATKRKLVTKRPGRPRVVILQAARKKLKRKIVGKTKAAASSLLREKTGGALKKQESTPIKTTNTSKKLESATKKPESILKKTDGTPKKLEPAKKKQEVTPKKKSVAHKKSKETDMQISRDSPPELPRISDILAAKVATPPDFPPELTNIKDSQSHVKTNTALPKHTAPARRSIKAKIQPSKIIPRKVVKNAPLRKPGRPRKHLLTTTRKLKAKALGSSRAKATKAPKEHVEQQEQSKIAQPPVLSRKGGRRRRAALFKPRRKALKRLNPASKPTTMTLKVPVLVLEASKVKPVRKTSPKASAKIQEKKPAVPSPPKRSQQKGKSKTEQPSNLSLETQPIILVELLTPEKIEALKQKVKIEAEISKASAEPASTSKVIADAPSGRSRRSLALKKTGGKSAKVGNAEGPKPPNSDVKEPQSSRRVTRKGAGDEELKETVAKIVTEEAAAAITANLNVPVISKAQSVAASTTPLTEDAATTAQPVTMGTQKRRRGRPPKKKLEENAVKEPSKAPEQDDAASPPSVRPSKQIALKRTSKRPAKRSTEEESTESNVSPSDKPNKKPTSDTLSGFSALQKMKQNVQKALSQNMNPTNDNAKPSNAQPEAVGHSPRQSTDSDASRRAPSARPKKKPLRLLDGEGTTSDEESSAKDNQQSTSNSRRSSPSKHSRQRNEDSSIERESVGASNYQQITEPQSREPSTFLPEFDSYDSDILPASPQQDPLSLDDEQPILHSRSQSPTPTLSPLSKRAATEENKLRGICFVLTCLGKSHKFFHPPKNDAGLFKRWERAIPPRERPLTEKDLICADHFSSKCLRSNVKAPWGKIIPLPQFKWKLQPGALPTLFRTPVVLVEKIQHDSLKSSPRSRPEAIVETPKCVVPGCKGTSKSRFRMTYHEFPFYIDYRKLWVREISRKTGVPIPDKDEFLFGKQVCGLHFDAKDYQGGVRSGPLKLSAVPSNFEFVGSTEPEPSYSSVASTHPAPAGESSSIKESHPSRVPNILKRSARPSVESIRSKKTKSDEDDIVPIYNARDARADSYEEAKHNMTYTSAKIASVSPSRRPPRETSPLKSYASVSATSAKPEQVTVQTTGQFTVPVGSFKDQGLYIVEGDVLRLIPTAFPSVPMFTWAQREQVVAPAPKFLQISPKAVVSSAAGVAPTVSMGTAAPLHSSLSASLAALPPDISVSMGPAVPPVGLTSATNHTPISVVPTTAQMKPVGPTYAADNYVAQELAPVLTNSVTSSVASTSTTASVNSRGSRTRKCAVRTYGRQSSCDSDDVQIIEPDSDVPTGPTKRPQARRGGRASVARSPRRSPTKTAKNQSSNTAKTTNGQSSSNNIGKSNNAQPSSKNDGGSVSTTPAQPVQAETSGDPKSKEAKKSETEILPNTMKVFKKNQDDGKYIITRKNGKTVVTPYDARTFDASNIKETFRVKPNGDKLRFPSPQEGESIMVIVPPSIPMIGIEKRTRDGEKSANATTTGSSKVNGDQKPSVSAAQSRPAGARRPGPASKTRVVKEVMTVDTPFSSGNGKLERIYENRKLLKLPGEDGWSIQLLQQTKDNKTEKYLFIAETVLKNDQPVQQRILKVRDTLKFELFANSKNITAMFNADDDQIRSFKALQELLDMFAAFNVCTGVEGFADIHESSCPDGTRVGNYWYSTACPSLCSDTNICFHCANLQTVLSMIRNGTAVIAPDSSSTGNFETQVLFLNPDQADSSALVQDDFVYLMDTQPVAISDTSNVQVSQVASAVQATAAAPVLVDSSAISPPIYVFSHLNT